MKQNDARKLAMGGVIAALYVALTFVAAAFGLASGAIQVRLSEALTILPVFTASAVPGLTVGCVLANLLTGCAPWDVVFGSLATLLGAIGTRLLKNKPYVAWIPPVVANAVIVPFVLQKVYGVEDAWWYLALTVGAGELIACGILGMLLYHSLKKIPSIKNLK
ncbi:MAG: QueT transporter family protein [Clostridia bacterium]|nr:QueT transporter family protein [Clostridia bacterium]MBR5382843.1 QueT transporter family protein [Clostridia bacterium]